jgi:hypothetical protein
MADTGITCPQIYYGTPTEVNGIQVDYRGVLRQGEVLTGTPTITISGPTTSSPAVSTCPLLINEENVEPGKAITFTITGGTDGSDYAIKTSCGTSASRTREVYCIYKVRVPTVSAP